MHENGLPWLEDQEPDRRDHEQVAGHGDQSPAMPLAKLPGDRERGGTHELRLSGWRCGHPDEGHEDLIEGRDALADAVRFPDGVQRRAQNDLTTVNHRGVISDRLDFPQKLLTKEHPPALTGDR